MSEKLLQLAAKVADVIVEEMKLEAAEVGETLSDYDIDSFADSLDDFSYAVQKRIERQLNREMISTTREHLDTTEKLLTD